MLLFHKAAGLVSVCHDRPHGSWATVSAAQFRNRE